MSVGCRNSADAGVVSGSLLTEPERILVSRCLQGDSVAWEVFVRSYGRRISRLVSRYTRLRGEAEDLTQEVFLRVYLHLKTFRADSGKLSHWVARVGRNLIIDCLRMRNRRFIQFQDNGEPALLDLQSDRTPTPETSIVREETSRLVHRSLDMLPPELQQVLVMRYLEELSHREISRRLRLPDGTIKSRIFRARARLAEVLGSPGPLRQEGIDQGDLLQRSDKCRG